MRSFVNHRKCVTPAFNLAVLIVFWFDEGIIFRAAWASFALGPRDLLPFYRSFSS
jgi:hypothetical protein